MDGRFTGASGALVLQFGGGTATERRGYKEAYDGTALTKRGYSGQPRTGMSLAPLLRKHPPAPRL